MRGAAFILFAGILAWADAHAANSTNSGTVIAPAATAAPTTPAPPVAPSTTPPAAALDPKLQDACEKGDLNRVQKLVEGGAWVNATEQSGLTPLIFASMHSAEVTKYLLAHGALVDMADVKGDTALNDACYFKRNDIALLLLDAGANPNLATRAGKTPLINAARDGNDALVRALLAHHADVNPCTLSFPPIWWAVSEDHLSTAQLLLDAGADPSLHSTNPVGPANPGANLLCWAVFKNDLPMIDLLLAHRADLNGKMQGGFTPLIKAILSAKSETVEYLLNKNPDVNLQDDSGQTALMWAILYDQPPIWQHLLSCGANIEARDKEGRTVLMHACINDYPPAVRFLLAQKADVNAVDHHGETALTHAGDHGATPLVALLKEAGATRTDLHIITRAAASPPLSKSRLWALAMGALYAQRNGYSHEKLEEPEFKDKCRRNLEQQWEVTNQAALLDRIARLQRGPILSYLLAEQTRDSLSRPDRESRLVRAFQLLYLDLWWREKTDVAWDLCRAANLVRVGVDAGYLQESEAWPLLMPIARRTQATFGSWREMSDNFLDGREIDANERSGNLRACARLLLNPNDPNSPWNQAPWRTDLSAH